jgi:hypothetical protein
MKKILKVNRHKYIRVMFIIFIAGCLLSFSCHRIQGNEKISEKMPSILAGLLNADDPVSYAKIHGMTLKDGMVRVIITVDKDIISKDLFSKYGLKDYQWRENLVAGYISTDGLKELCEEPAVIYIRLPVKFMGGEEPNNNVEK